MTAFVAIERKQEVFGRARAALFPHCKVAALKFVAALMQCTGGQFDQATQLHREVSYLKCPLRLRHLRGSSLSRSSIMGRQSVGIAAALAVAFAGPHVAGAQSGTVVEGIVGARLDSALTLAARNGFNGVVRIEQGGKLLLAKGYGLANRERNIPFAPATVVQIGSNTKDFTLVALMRLDERGTLSLRDSLGKFFPDAPADKRGITLQQIVDHRGGFPIGFGGDFDAVSRAQFLKRALASPLRAAPGTKEIYSNAGYAILAAVIEYVTGTDYDQYIYDDLLAPLGLRETGYLLPHFDESRLAHGYQTGNDRGTLLSHGHAADGPYWNLRGNGGMLSTVADMHRFYKVLFDTDSLLPARARRGRFDPDGPVGLAGSDMISFFLYERLPGRRIEIIIATNSAESQAPTARRAVAQVLGLPLDVDEGGNPNRSPAAPPPGAKPPPAAVAAIVNGFVRAVNSGDQATIRTFIVEHFSTDGILDQRLERFGGMRERLGTLSLSSIWQDGPDAVSAALTTSREGPATFSFELEHEPPFRIRSVKVLVGG